MHHTSFFTEIMFTEIDLYTGADTLFLWTILSIKKEKKHDYNSFLKQSSTYISKGQGII